MPKGKKINKKKISNVISIKKDVIPEQNNDLLLSVEDQERERTNKFARKICDEIDDYVMKQSWATITGEEEPEIVVADKCAKLLLDISQ